MRCHFLLALFYLLATACAQTPPTDLSSKLTSVTVGFFALDGDKHSYADLKQSEFVILDNKQPVRSIISLKKGSELPLRLGLLVDASASERHSSLYKPEVVAAADFLKQIMQGPEDKLFVVKVTVLADASDFMTAAQFSDYRLSMIPQGGTALYDGVSCAADKMRTAEQGSRRVLIVLSDGDDNLSHIPRSAAIEKALQAGVAIFSVSTQDEFSAYAYGGKGDSTLEHFADETGGAAFVHLNPKKIEQSFSAMAAAIDDMYFVTFEPVDASERGLHRIELRSSGKDKIRFHAPKGYYLK
jgi:VWFA-related protein